MKKWFLLLLLLVLGCGSGSDSIEFNKISGIWYAELTQSFPDGSSMSSKGTSEYFGDGSCNAIGQYVLSIPEQDYTYQITYNYVMTSNWKIQNNSLIERTMDIKSHPILLQRGTKKIDLRQLTSEKRNQIIRTLPNIQDLVPKGMTVKSKILSMTNDRMVLSTPDGKGGNDEYVVQRVEKPFQFE